jgi:DNA-binding beta-propeller fold protein YncE
LVELFLKKFSQWSSGGILAALAFGLGWPAVSVGEIPRISRVSLGESSTRGEVRLELVARIRSYAGRSSTSNDRFDSEVQSPKSALFSADGRKAYLHCLEGFSTLVVDAATWSPRKTIRHEFGPAEAGLFLRGESTLFDYGSAQESQHPNTFQGKPVESCLTHQGRYLWVTYYRRDYDRNAQYPSAVAIIDTVTDEIVRVMPTGPLPKMVAASPDGKWVAVTHWGDNTVGLINVQGADPAAFYYVQHLTVGERLRLNFGGEEKVDRDRNCGCCLRGTVFTPDSRYLLVGKMGAGGGVAVFDLQGFRLAGTLQGMRSNIRHLVIHGENLFLSANGPGYVQKTAWPAALAALTASGSKGAAAGRWQEAFVGRGARTIVLTKDARYLFAAVNDSSRVKVVRTDTMQVVATVAADSYPVGLALSPDETLLAVTAQGKEDATGKSVGGNSVMFYRVERCMP